MAKAINWSKEFYDEVINEDSNRPKIALRIGNLYYDNKYYTKGEKVDIRVDHKVVRKALITDDLRVSKIKDLSDDVLLLYKKSLGKQADVISFLTNNYNQPVDEETIVTIVTYQNMPEKENTAIDDPHF